jgi:hypothetical protein
MAGGEERKKANRGSLFVGERAVSRLSHTDRVSLREMKFRLTLLTVLGVWVFCCSTASLKDVRI